ncbi:MAG: 4Fe-4S dicluster domain-containing protein [Desulfobacterales bacterium]|nr:4Fe-4S dicluster domain-containing protein [Desulfobacterales bacterium]MBS3755966.1 4Fe-4S dicluster domain-containing protein [Desulfobacterales bacterium]
MMKRPFFGIATPKLKYDVIEDVQPEPVTVQPKQRVTLFIEKAYDRADKALIKKGAAVVRGQRLQLFDEDPAAYAICPVSGVISEISPFIGMMEKQMTAVVIDTESDREDDRDTAFKEVSGTPSIEDAARFLGRLPGKPDFTQFTDADRMVKTIAVLGADQDLQSITGQYIIKTGISSVKTGIDILRKITGVQNIVLVVAQHQVQVAGTAAAGVRSVGAHYPSAHPEMIIRHLLAEQAEQGQIAFLTAEAVAGIGAAYNTGELPLEKQITVAKKDGTRQLVTAPVGTHAADILDAVNEQIENGDRLIMGGPMTGDAVYSLEHPVEPDTEAIMVQDKETIVEGTDTPCTNCGECVRICPANIPVNELVRLLDAGEYEQAAEQAALFSCIECGLCAYVCESRIPIFQFIRLAKHAVKRMRAAEEANA